MPSTHTEAELLAAQTDEVQSFIRFTLGNNVEQTGQAGWRYYGQSWEQVQKLACRNHARIIDLALMPGTDRWAVTLIGI